MKPIKELKEILNEKIPSSNEILIVPHISPDFDALASSVGLVNICKKLDKKAYILVNEKFSEMNASVNEMVNEIKEQYDIIDLKDYLNIKDKLDLLITTDVNNIELVAIKDYLNNFKTKIIIDHHEESENTIKTNYKFIDSKRSSASEIIAKLLYSYKFKYDNKCANYLYAGISLDTNKLRKNISYETLSIASKLVMHGADIAYTDNLFHEDFENDRKIQELINHTSFKRNSYAITCGKDIIYTKEDLAKAADYIMQYKVDAAFAIGFIDKDLIRISGRSNGNINISNILKIFGGGGHLMSGAATINSNNIDEIKNKLNYILSPGNINIDEILFELSDSFKEDIKTDDISKKLRFTLSGNKQLKRDS